MRVLSHKTNKTFSFKGYRRYYIPLRDYLKKEFGDLINVEEEKDRGITGNFEVIIVNTNTLIHSKRHGQGKAESAREKQLIVDQIKEALESLKCRQHLVDANSTQ